MAPGSVLPAAPLVQLLVTTHEPRDTSRQDLRRVVASDPRLLGRGRIAQRCDGIAIGVDSPAGGVMKAIQCVQWGGPERLQLSEVPLPEPTAGEVRIRVAAAGVNFPDALIIQKKYQVQPPLPFVPGTEVAGTIDAVGEGVSRLKAGERVVAFVGLGGFAQYVCVAQAQVAPLPANVDLAVAAGFTLTYATAQHALVERGQLSSGETLLVLGAGGGVGLAAVELGKLAGARVIAAASSEEKLKAAREVFQLGRRPVPPEFSSPLTEPKSSPSGEPVSA